MDDSLQAQLDAAKAVEAELTAKIMTLEGEVSALHRQIEVEKEISESLRVALAAATGRVDRHGP
jgi:capsule polysaccharide export protein KpsE/RkpR